jgi:putative transposase
MMEERGTEVDHSSLNRWVRKYVPLLDKVFRARKRRVGGSWRMDETYVRIRGQWKYLYRAVDKAGNTFDSLLTAKRNRKAALRFLYRAIGQHGAPSKIAIDKSAANTAAIENYNSEHGTKIELRQVNYLNNIVEQDHRAIRRKVRPMMGFNSLWSASVTLAGIELMHMIRKGQLKTTGQLRPVRWPADFHGGYGAAPLSRRNRDKTDQLRHINVAEELRASAGSRRGGLPDFTIEAGRTQSRGLVAATRRAMVLLHSISSRKPPVRHRPTAVIAAPAKS